jgi:hypothetical protein
MAKSPRPWIVSPHDPLERLDENLWAVAGQVPGMPLNRRMAIARRDDGVLFFYNAVPVNDETLAEIQALGRPGYLVIPNAFHRLDAHAFRARLGVKLLCAASAARGVAKVAPVDGTLEELPSGGGISTSIIAGTRVGEATMTVRSQKGSSIVFADAVMNVPKPLGLMTRIFRTAGGPKCPPLFRLAFVKDKRAVQASLAALAADQTLIRLVPSHGDVLAVDVPKTLATIARRDL